MLFKRPFAGGDRDFSALYIYMDIRQGLASKSSLQVIH
jgi:hypothetical protein